MNIGSVGTMISRLASIAIPLAVAVAVGIGPAFAAGDAKSGLGLARQWCASCHTVEPGAVISDRAPPFAGIAQRRDTDWIKAWLAKPHPPMTGIDLSRAQIGDLTAYIQSLAAQ